MQAADVDKTADAAGNAPPPAPGPVRDASARSAASNVPPPAPGPVRDASARSAASSPVRAPLWNRSFVALIALNLFMVLGNQITNTLIPLYGDALGCAAGLVGVLSGIFALSSLAVRPFAGPAFDSFSKKRLLVLSLLVEGAAISSFAFLDTPGAIIAMRLMQGIGMGCAGALGVALVADVIPEDRMASGISIYAIAQAVGQALGPAFGIWVKDVAGFSAAFLLVGGLLLICIVLLLAVHEPRQMHRPPYRLSLNRCFSTSAMLDAGVLALLTVSFSCTFGFMALYGGLRGVPQIGLYFTVYAGCLILTRPFFGKLADKHGGHRFIPPAMCCFAVSFAMVSFSASLPAFLGAALVAAFGFGVCSPLLQADALASVPDDARGSASNTVFMGLDLGNLVGPMIAGNIIQNLTGPLGSEVAAYSAMWQFMLVPIGLALALFLVGRLLAKRRAQ